MIPPSPGPAIDPSDTKRRSSPVPVLAQLIGNTSVMIPVFVAIVILAPIAWTTRAKSKKANEWLNPHNKEPMVKINICRDERT